MNDYEEIEKSLRNLPRYSLKDHQKKRVLQRIKTNQMNKKRRLFLYPSISLVISLGIIAVLIINEWNTLDTSIDQESNTARISFTSPEGKMFKIPESNLTVLGIENKVGFFYGGLGDQEILAREKRRLAKIMIFFWGSSDNLTGQPFRVEALHESGKQLTLSEGILFGPIYNADAHAVTRFKPFPKKGTWELSFYVNDKRYGSFIANVLPPPPQTEHYTLRTSPKETTVHHPSVLYIESTKEDHQEISVVLKSKSGKTVDRETFQLVSTHIDADTRETVYLYKGKITFPSIGDWIFVIDGEQTNLFKN